MIGKNTTPHDVAKAAQDFVMAFLHAPEAEKHIAFRRLRDVMDAVYWPSPLSGADQPPAYHVDPTGTAREPPHCPTCACGATAQPSDTRAVCQFHGPLVPGDDCNLFCPACATADPTSSTCDTQASPSS